MDQLSGDQESKGKTTRGRKRQMQGIQGLEGQIVKLYSREE